MQFSSGLNYLIDNENTVIAMWRLRLRTYDEVAATKPRSSGLTWRHFRVGHNGTHCAAARLPRRQHARRFAVASPGAATAGLVAVLRLIAMSNLVDCTTGRSAGFSP